MSRGRFITFEGTEGAGKTSALEVARHCLVAAGHTVVVTREPGGTALGEELRTLLLSRDMGEDCEVLLMFAARAEHLHQVIRPALARGDWVLSDRFTDATFAYQGGGRGVSLARLAVLETWVQQDLRPDLTLWFDVPVTEGLVRAGRRGPADRFERETVAFFERVRRAYAERAVAEPVRIRRIDAAKAMDEVHDDVRHELAMIAGL